MIILGIDPGIATMGYGVVDKDVNGNCRAVDYGVVVTPKEETLPVRLAMLEEGVNKIIDKFLPAEVALEELFFAKNITTGIAVAQARGVTLLACVKKCGRLYEYTPMQIKQALTGYGRADKQQMQQVVASLLKLKAPPRPDDAADALAIALCHAFTSRFGTLFSVENNTRTKDKNAVTGSYFKSAMELDRKRKRDKEEYGGKSVIAYLRGRVLTTTAETVIVDVNGVGYEVYCSGSAFGKIGSGDVAELYTYLQVKEDGITLFGFSSVREKELFLKLISVSGVGPKMGIGVLSVLNADDLAAAVATADVKRLSAVKGLGKKTAEKIILELHGKISAAEIMNANGDAPSAASEGAENGRLTPAEEDAVSALMGLGFNRSESIRAVKKAHDAGARTTEEAIRKALQSGV